MPRTRRCPPKRVSSSPEAGDSDVEIIHVQASKRPGQSKSAKVPKPIFETPSKRRPVSVVPETPSKRQCRPNGTASEEDGDLPSHQKPYTKSTPQAKKQSGTCGSDVWALSDSECGEMVGGDYADQGNAGADSGKMAADSEAEREQEYERGQQYHREESHRKKGGERRDLEIKAKRKVQTNLRTYSARQRGSSVSMLAALPGSLNKRDSMRDNRARTIKISGGDGGEEDSGEDPDLQEALRRSVHDTGQGQPLYQKLEPENRKAGPATKNRHPPLPQPNQVPTIGKSDALADLKITLEIDDVPLPPTVPRAKIMVVRFPLSIVGNKDLLHCVSNYETSILFVWGQGADFRGTKNELIDLENLDENRNQSLPETRKVYLGGEVMGKIEIPKGYKIMRTTEKIKSCDTGSGFSMRKFLIGISRERGQKKGEGAWVVVRVGIVTASRDGHPGRDGSKEKEMIMLDLDTDSDTDVDQVMRGAAPRQLIPPFTPAKLHGRRQAMSPAPSRGESPDLSVVTPVNLFGVKTVRPSDLELRKARPEVEVGVTPNCKSLWEDIIEGEGILELGNPKKRIRKRGNLSKDRPLAGEYDDGLDERMEGSAMKLKISPREERMVDAGEERTTSTSFAEAKPASAKDPFTDTIGGDGEDLVKQRGTIALGRNPKIVQPGGGVQEELDVKEEMNDKQMEKGQQEKCKAGRLTKSVQKARAPGLGGVRGGTCVKAFSDISLDGEDAFGIEGGDFYIPEIA